MSETETTTVVPPPFLDIKCASGRSSSSSPSAALMASSRAPAAGTITRLHSRQPEALGFGERTAFRFGNRRGKQTWVQRDPRLPMRPAPMRVVLVAATPRSILAIHAMCLVCPLGCFESNAYPGDEILSLGTIAPSADVRQRRHPTRSRHPLDGLMVRLAASAVDRSGGRFDLADILVDRTVPCCTSV